MFQRPRSCQNRLSQHYFIKFSNDLVQNLCGFESIFAGDIFNVLRTFETRNKLAKITCVGEEMIDPFLLANISKSERGSQTINPITYDNSSNDVACTFSHQISQICLCFTLQPSPLSMIHYGQTYYKYSIISFNW